MHRQATGEATYVDDIPVFANELHGYLVMTTVSRGRVVSVDPSAALAVQGVHAYIDHKNVQGEKNAIYILTA